MKQENELELERCPHCNVVKPRLIKITETSTTAHSGGNERKWVLYQCVSCGGLVLTGSPGKNGDIFEIYPRARAVNQTVPTRARQYLTQAIDSLHAPAGAVMLAASAVDAMLKEKGYKDGSLYSRIDTAAKDHLITLEMAEWAHEVRLEANDQRHADESAQLPKEADAQRVLEFADALAQFLFVLPARVDRGRQNEPD